MTHCVCCGNLLSESENNSWWLTDAPPACDDCFEQVMEETDKDLPMWPSDWYGHAARDRRGVWVTHDPESNI